MIEYTHGGDIYGNQITLDFSANINPLGLPDGVKEAVIRELSHCDCYPDSSSRELRRAIGEFHQIPKEHIICSNGAADLIFQVVLAQNPQKAMLIAPSFSEYEQALKTVNCQIQYYDLKEQDGFSLSVPDFLKELDDSLEMLFLCNPNNPTGLAILKSEMIRIIEVCEARNIFLVIDECFCDFLEEKERYSVIAEISGYPHILVIKAFTKLYAMAGIRLGYGISSNRKLLERIQLVRQPWSVSSLAQAAGMAALKETDYVERTIALMQEERKYLTRHLSRLGFSTYPSKANYLFFKDVRECIQKPLQDCCKEKKVLLRWCANYHGLDEHYYRICIKGRAENEILIQILEEIIHDEAIREQV